MPATINSATAAIAHELISLCRAGHNIDAIEKFYSPNIVSIEPMGNEKTPAETRGIDAVRKKNEWWVENNGSRNAGSGTTTNTARNKTR